MIDATHVHAHAQATEVRHKKESLAVQFRQFMDWIYSKSLWMIRSLFTDDFARS